MHRLTSLPAMANPAAEIPLKITTKTTKSAISKVEIAHKCFWGVCIYTGGCAKGFGGYLCFSSSLNVVLSVRRASYIRIIIFKQNAKKAGLKIDC